MQRFTVRLFDAPPALLLIAGVCLSLVGAGCNKSEAATTRERQSKVQGEGAASSKVETDHYKIELRPKGKYAKDAEGAFEVVLETKGDYHINEQYPYKFTPKSGVEGVSYKGPVGREAGQFDKTRAVITVPFTPSKTGSVTVGGKLSLSVCSDKNCLMEKQELETSVDVK